MGGAGNGGRGCGMVGGALAWWEGLCHGVRGSAYDSPKLEDCHQIF